MKRADSPLWDVFVLWLRYVRICPVSLMGPQACRRDVARVNCVCRAARRVSLDAVLLVDDDLDHPDSEDRQVCFGRSEMTIDR